MRDPPRRWLSTRVVAAVLVLAISSTGVSGCSTMTTTQKGFACAVAVASAALLARKIWGKDATGWGALSGALACAIALQVGEYRAKQSRSESAVLREDGAEVSEGTTFLRIREGRNVPTQVSAGESVTLTTDYSVIVASPQTSVAVDEEWQLWKDGQMLAEASEDNKQRTTGGWTIDATIPIPVDATPGQYTVKHIVSAGTTKAEPGNSDFIVVAAAKPN